MHFYGRRVCNLIRISLRFVLNCDIDYKSAIVQGVTWCWTWDNPLSRSIVTMMIVIFIISFGDTCLHSTVECCCNAVQHGMIWNTSLQWLWEKGYNAEFGGIIIKTIIMGYLESALNCYKVHPISRPMGCTLYGIWRQLTAHFQYAY